MYGVSVPETHTPKWGCLGVSAIFVQGGCIVFSFLYTTVLAFFLHYTYSEAQRVMN
jgi:hypothetical protein